MPRRAGQSAPAGRLAPASRPHVGDDGRPAAPPSDVPAPESGDDSHERLLAAVRAEVLEVGLDKVSVTSVARRAGLARITLYRHSGDVKRLVLTALTRETQRVIAQARAGLPDGPGRTRAVELGMGLVRGVSQSAFVLRIVGSDPGLLEPYLTDHLGASQRALLAAAAPELERGMVDGSIRRADPEVMGTVLLQALTPFAVAPRIPLRELGEAAVEREVRRLIDGYLRPTEAP